MGIKNKKEVHETLVGFELLHASLNPHVVMLRGVGIQKLL